MILDDNNMPINSSPYPSTSGHQVRHLLNHDIDFNSSQFNPRMSTSQSPMGRTVVSTTGPSTTVSSSFSRSNNSILSDPTFEYYYSANNSNHNSHTYPDNSNSHQPPQTSRDMPPPPPPPQQQQQQHQSLPPSLPLTSKSSSSSMSATGRASNDAATNALPLQQQQQTSQNIPDGVYLYQKQPTLQPPSTNSKMTRSSSRGGFFSKFRRNSSSQQDEDPEENELFKSREEGWNAGVFGFVPSFPTPPKYIWVHAHKKRNREFTRMFLAQELGDTTSHEKISSSASRFNRRRSSSNDSRPRSSSSDPDRKRDIWCAKFSPDGVYLATAGADSIIRIWKVLSDSTEREQFENGELSDDEQDPPFPSFPHEEDEHQRHSHLLTPPSQQSTSSTSKSYRRGSMRISHKKKQIVSAPVFLPKPVLEYVGHSQGILDLCWSKNNFLLSSSMDKTVRLWHPQYSQSIKTFTHSDFVTSIAFHPSDDRFFLSGSLDCRVRLWSITENKVEYHRDAPDYVMAVAFSPDGNTAVVGCFGGQCIFYETDGLRQKNQMIVKSSHGRNSNGSRITGIQIMNISKSRSSHSSSTKADNFSFNRANTTVSGDTKLLVSTGDSRIRMYNFADRTLEAKYKGHTTIKGQIHSFFSDSGDYIISGSEDEKTYIWRTTSDSDATSRTRESYEYFHSNKAVVNVALFAPTASRALLYNSRDPIYDLAMPPPVILTPSSTGDSRVSQAPPASISIDTSSGFKANAHDGNIIITCDQDGVIKVFRQDCAYERRKQAAETASLIQKKRIGGIALTPTQSWRDNGPPSILSNVTNVNSSTGVLSASSSTSFSPSIVVTASQTTQNSNNTGASQGPSAQASSTSTIGTIPTTSRSSLPVSSSQQGGPIRSNSRTRFADAPTYVGGGRSTAAAAAAGINRSNSTQSMSSSYSHQNSALGGSQPFPGTYAHLSPQLEASIPIINPTHNVRMMRSNSHSAVVNGPPNSTYYNSFSGRNSQSVNTRAMSYRPSRADSPSSVSSLESFSPRRLVAQALAGPGGGGGGGGSPNSSVIVSNGSSSSTPGGGTSPSPKPILAPPLISLTTARNGSPDIQNGGALASGGGGGAGAGARSRSASPLMFSVRPVGASDHSVNTPSNLSNSSDSGGYLRCESCGSTDFKVKPTQNGPAIVCTQCGTIHG